MESLLHKWKNKKKVETDLGSTSISKAPDNANIPLSFGQLQLWFLQTLYPENPFYNYTEVYVFKGILNIRFLEEAIQQIILDHDILRTIYIDQIPEPVQKINTHLKPNIEFNDFSDFSALKLETELANLALKNANTKFFLDEAPLFKFTLVKCSGSEHRFYATFNHIIMDSWSMLIFRNQLALHYRNLSKNKSLESLKSRLQYSDYSYYERNAVLSDKQVAYWKTKFNTEAPTLNLPLDHQRPQTPSYKGAMASEEYSLELSKDILELSKKMGVTPFVFMLSAFYSFLHNLSDQNDICVGTPITQRDEKELQELIGFFIDTIVLRTRLLPQMSFLDLVQEVKKTTLDAFSNKNVPFGILVKTLKPKRSLNLNPIFQAMFVYNKELDPPLLGKDLTLEYHPHHAGVSKFDLTLHIFERGSILSSSIEYATDLFDYKTIKKFQEQLKLLLKNIINDHTIQLSEIITKKSLNEH